MWAAPRACFGCPRLQASVIVAQQRSTTSPDVRMPVCDQDIRQQFSRPMVSHPEGRLQEQESRIPERCVHFFPEYSAVTSMSIESAVDCCHCRHSGSPSRLPFHVKHPFLRLLTCIPQKAICLRLSDVYCSMHPAYAAPLSSPGAGTIHQIYPRVEVPVRYGCLWHGHHPPYILN